MDRNLDQQVAEALGKKYLGVINSDGMDILPWSPSSYIQDAWPLFEMMPGGLLIGKSLTIKDGFQILKLSDDGKGMEVYAEAQGAQGASEAICKAFLEYMKIKTTTTKETPQ